jgi:hypothetical protein
MSFVHGFRVNHWFQPFTVGGDNCERDASTGVCGLQPWKRYDVEHDRNPDRGTEHFRIVIVIVGDGGGKD